MIEFTRMDRRWKISETATHVFFVGSPFSQWWMRAPFTTILRLNDELEAALTFNCAEQYMMAGKAALFGDYDTLEAIMRADNPKEQKALGRQVKNFDTAIWNENARRIVTQGNLAKFEQNASIREFLFLTGDKTIVEGAYYDPVWGVKLAWDDPRITDPANWQGTNWLGECLMETRRILRERLILRIDPQHDANW